MPTKHKKHLTCKQKAAFIKEEKATAKLYKNLGFTKQGRQEKEHSLFFRKQTCH